MPLPPTAVELRRGVLAVSVLHDLDVDPTPLGVSLPGSPTVWVPWGECRRALAGHPPESTTGRSRLRGWLQARRWAADLPRDVLLASLVPLGLPVEHVLHPGLDWVADRVLGGALDLGAGCLGLDPDDPEAVLALPPPALLAAGLDPQAVWPALRERLEELGALAGERLRTDSRGMLRPYGPCDVVTLLGARALRAEVAEQAGGMAAAVVPMRRRGWTRMALIDPAFGPAAAAATEAQDRGFARPLLVTADELTVVVEGGRTGFALDDPSTDTPWLRDVLYR